MQLELWSIVNCRQKQEEASAAQKQFFHPTGDHLTLASVFFAYKQVVPSFPPFTMLNIIHLPSASLEIAKIL